MGHCAEYTASGGREYLDYYLNLNFNDLARQYILALEIIIDREAGTILGHSAYTESDTSPELVRRIIEDVESMAIALAREDFYCLESFKGSKTKSLTNGIVNEDSDDSDDDNEEIEPGYLEKVMQLVSKFLKVDRSILKPTSSLISFGLDSIKYVGLSRALKKAKWVYPRWR